MSVGGLQPDNILVDMKMWDLSGCLLCLLAQWPVPGRARYVSLYYYMSVSLYYYDVSAYYYDVSHNDSAGAAAGLCDILLHVSSY